MIKLYIMDGCPYCQKVMRKIEELKLEKGKDFEIVDSLPGTQGREELIKIGGKGQVPFLVDGDQHMYESDDIIGYIEEKFKK